VLNMEVEVESPRKEGSHHRVETIPSVVKWSFGEGHEGVFVQPTTGSEQVLVVGRSVPWWGMVVARLDLRIHSILLSDDRFSSVVREYFGTGIPVGKSTNQSRSDILMTRNALRNCSVVALESLPKPKDVLSEIWVMSSVRLILVSSGKLIVPPPGWSRCHKSVQHKAVGGVTDLKSEIGIYFRCNPDNGSTTIESPHGTHHPSRDLRAILKMAVGGRRCASPSEAQRSSHRIGCAVNEVRPGVVMNSGLLKVKTRSGSLLLPRVKTPFGGEMWVIRPLSPAEVISCWDVPEKLGHLIGTNEGKAALMKEIFTPSKIRQSVLEEIRPLLDKLIRNLVWSREDLR
jgi:hypothetical protein